MSKRSERKERKRAQAQAAADVARVSVTGTNQGAQVRVQAGRDLANDPWAEQHRLRGAFGRFLVGVVVLTLTIAISPGISADGIWAVPIAALLTSIVAAVLRPLMIRIAGPFGWAGALLLAFFGNFVILYLAFFLISAQV